LGGMNPYKPEEKTATGPLPVIVNPVSNVKIVFNIIIYIFL
jgi:hypothetical protein